MEIKKNTLGNFFSKLLVICGFLMFIFMSIFSYISLMPIFTFKIVMVIQIIITICGFAVLSVIVNRYLTGKQFLILLVIIGFGIRVLWIMFEKTPPVSDFSFMYVAAENAANGNFSFTSDDYFMSWAYQLGFTYYEAIIIKLFGDHIFILKLFNIIFTTGTSVLVYLIAKRIFNEFSGRTAAMLFTFYIPTILYCSVLTNQHISTFLFFLGLYIFLTKGLTSKYGWALTGLVLSVGNIMRPEGSFFLIGICTFTVIFKVFPLRKKESFTYFKKLIGILIIYFLVLQVVSIALLSTGLAKKPLSNQAPYWKFVVGLNYDSVGGWNPEDSKYISKFKLGEERNKASKALVTKRLQDKKKVLHLFFKKTIKLWTYADDAPIWSLMDLNKPDLQLLLTKYERLMYIAACLFAIGTISLFRVNNHLAALLYILLGGYAVIHLLVETQTRYRFDILPLFFIVVGYGVFSMKKMILKLTANAQKKEVEESY